MFEDILGNRDLTLPEKNQKELERIWQEYNETKGLLNGRETRATE